MGYMPLPHSDGHWKKLWTSSYSITHVLILRCLLVSLGVGLLLHWVHNFDVLMHEELN